jgi:hypothetical protein
VLASRKLRNPSSGPQLNWLEQRTHKLLPWRIRPLLDAAIRNGIKHFLTFLQAVIGSTLMRRNGWLCTHGYTEITLPMLFISLDDFGRCEAAAHFEQM